MLGIIDDPLVSKSANEFPNEYQIFVLFSVSTQLPIIMEPSSKDAFKKAKNRALRKAKNTCTLSTFLSWFPIINWIRNYKVDYLSGDIIAGVTCALTVIPQGIGYAPLAGLPLEVSSSALAVEVII